MNQNHKKARQRAARFLSQSDGSRPAWTPFVRAVDRSDEEEKIAVMVNSRYQVEVREAGVGELGHLIWLSIKGLERDTRHDWRDFQRLKNEIVGPEWEAVEIYPAESRLVDGANQFHLWCFDKRLPFGFHERLVSVPGKESAVVQRPWENGAQPDDVEVITMNKHGQRALSSQPEIRVPLTREEEAEEASRRG